MLFTPGGNKSAPQKPHRRTDHTRKQRCQEPFLHRGRGHKRLGLGSGQGRTRACRRRETASAPTSLRLFPAPDAWRSALYSVNRRECSQRNKATCADKMSHKKGGASQMTVPQTDQRQTTPTTGPTLIARARAL